MISGCAEFTILEEELDLNRIEYWWWRLNVKGVVTELGSNQSEQATNQIRVTNRAVSLEIEAEEDTFRTGLPYSATVNFKNIQTDLVNQTVQICYDLIDSREWWNAHQTLCSNFTVDSVNGVPFTIPPLTSNVTRLYIRVINF